MWLSLFPFVDYTSPDLSVWSEEVGVLLHRVSKAVHKVQQVTIGGQDLGGVTWVKTKGSKKQRREDLNGNFLSENMQA